MPFLMNMFLLIVYGGKLEAEGFRFLPAGERAQRCGCFGDTRALGASATWTAQHS